MKIQLSGFQVFCFISSSYLALLFWTFPRYANQYGGVNSPWSMFLTSILGVFVGWLHAKLNDTFQTVSGIGMLQIVYGRILGKILATAFAAIYLIFVSVSVYVYCDATVRVFLPQTPFPVLLIAIISVATFGAYQGVETISRVAAILLPLTWLFVILTVIQARFVLPEVIWKITTPTDLGSMMAAVYHLFPLYLGISTALMISPYYKHKPWSSMKILLMSTALAGVISTLVFLDVTSTFGYVATRRLHYPTFSLINLLNIQGWLIERQGIVIVLVSTGFTILFISNTLWCLSKLMMDVFELRDVDYKSAIVPISVAMTIACILIDPEELDNIMATVLTPASWLLLVVEPGLKLIIAKAMHKSR